MKFIVDAQLPLRLALWFRYQGFDCVHTLELPEANQTKDDYIRNCSIEEQRVVVTKDTDFLKSFMVKRIPPKLLLVTTGNITNNHLMSLFSIKKETIISSLEAYDMIELNVEDLIVFEG
jgi:predicted nuclease of predicted toxin-antitoxin system